MKRLAWVSVMVLALCWGGGAVANSAVAYPLTGSGLVEYAYDRLGAGYIMGGYGQVCDADFRWGRAELYPEYQEIILNFGKQWDGLQVYDCIGLFKAFAIQGGMSVAEVRDVNVTRAYELWVTEWGSLEGAILQPGMALFRVEGARGYMPHIGIYVGEGKIVHSRGTRWGVVMDDVPGTFTHWAKLSWIEYDLSHENEVYTDKPWLDVGQLAVIDTDNEKPAPVFAQPPESQKRAENFSTFPFGTVVCVVNVSDEMGRLVTGYDRRGELVTGYVRLTALSAYE